MNFIQKFKIPEIAYPYINKMFTHQEIEFVDKMNKTMFTKKDIAEIIGGGSDEFIKSCYKRGIISLVDEAAKTYKLSDFYGRLDIFSISEQEAYRSIPKEGQIALDAWYFEAYYNGLAADQSIRPTQDIFLPLDRALAFIDAQDRPVYLNDCDCRSLRGECGKPTRVCITYKNGINSFVHRGLSEEIDKEQAKKIVKEADRKGLMHIVNPNGICNCCGDCCYLCRSQAKRESLGFWPKTEQIIAYNPEQCTGCGVCIKRCYFNVFSMKDGVLTVDHSKCAGCGICVRTCPTKSLELKERI